MTAWLPDITDFQLTQKYWDGTNTYLCLKWTEKGFTPESLDISELELPAKRYENAEQLQAYEQRCNMREENISGMNCYKESWKSTLLQRISIDESADGTETCI